MQQSATDQSLANIPTIQPDDLSQMVDDLFTTMLGMPVDSTQESAEPPTNALQASVQIRGDWTAMLQIIASKEFASHAANAMFGVDPSELTEDEILDALGEVANVIGGNAKGVVDKDCSLTIPCVGGYAKTEAQSNTTQLSYQFRGEPMHVVLTES